MNKLTINDLKIGDLVKLRDDLVDEKMYGDIAFCDRMKYKGFKRITSIGYDDVIPTFTIKGMNKALFDCHFNYTPDMVAEVKRPVKYGTIYKYKEPILDDVEKRYLSAVIRPFRNRVTFIEKRELHGCYPYPQYYIAIDIKGECVVSLPTFIAGTMYKGMKVNKKYTLEELDL